MNSLSLSNVVVTIIIQDNLMILTIQLWVEPRRLEKSYWLLLSSKMIFHEGLESSFVPVFDQSCKIRKCKINVFD